MHEQEQISAAPEGHTPPLQEAEQVIRRALTPGQARLIAYAATASCELLTPNRYSALPALSEQIRTARAEDLPFAAGERVSTERRNAYWQEGSRAGLTFAEQNRQWNAALTAWVSRLQRAPGPDPSSPPQAERARETLAGLGLTGRQETVEKSLPATVTGAQSVTLNREVEAFRERFLAGTSDIRSFVHTLAHQCADANGTVDLRQLYQRLAAIRPLLVVFGDKAVDSLVYGYILSFGLLSQHEPRLKAILVQETQVKLQEEISGREAPVYQALRAHEATRNQDATGQTEPQAPPGEQVFPQPSNARGQARGAPANAEADTQHEAPAGSSPPQTAGEPASPHAPGEPPVQSMPQQASPDAPEAGSDIERFVATVERRLQEELGRPVSLTAEQKAALPIIPTGEWRGGWYGYRGTITPITENEYIAVYLDQYRRLQAKGLSHEQILVKLNSLLHRGNIDIDEDGKTFAVGWQETGDGVAWLVARSYRRQP